VSVGRVLELGIFAIVVVVVALFTSFVFITMPEKNVSSSGRTLYMSPYKYSINYPKRWQVVNKSLANLTGGEIELLLAPKNSSNIFLCLFRPKAANGVKAVEYLMGFEKERYKADPFFTAMIYKSLFSEDEEAEEMFYKTYSTALSTDIYHKKVVIIKNDTLYEMEYFAPSDKYRLFETDADSIFTSFKKE